MSISERLFKILEERGIKRAEFARMINSTPQAIKNWKDRGTTPPMEYLPIICEVLGVSWEYLVKGEKTEHHYTSEEIHLIKQFRKLYPENQSEIFDFIEFKIQRQ